MVFIVSDLMSWVFLFKYVNYTMFYVNRSVDNSFVVINQSINGK